MRSSNVALDFPHHFVSHVISPDVSRTTRTDLSAEVKGFNVLLWLPFHFAWSKWVNYEMEAGFWTEANWPVQKTGPIWEQSPTDISSVQICYGNEYHCCLGGPASELKWWMTASCQISPPDVRLSQSAWTSVKINMKEKCCLTTQTWLPADLLVLITGWHLCSVKAVFSANVEGVEIIGSCFFQVVIREAHKSSWSLYRG